MRTREPVIHFILQKLLCCCYSIISSIINLPILEVEGSRRQRIEGRRDISSIINLPILEVEGSRRQRIEGRRDFAICFALSTQ
jgi:hypothetical protein